MARYGLNVSDVQDTWNSIASRKSRWSGLRGDRRFNIVVRLPEELRTDIEALKQIRFPYLAHRLCRCDP